jgi:hypothetical protein
MLWGVAMLVILVWWLTLSGGDQPVVAAVESVPAAAKRLTRVRELAATVATREQELKAASAGVAEREKGMIQAETLPQAQAQLLQIVRRVAGAETPPIEIRSVEVAQSGRLGDDYGEISIPINIECQIEQLVNLMAGLTNQAELVSVRSLRIGSRDAKEKKISVRIVVSGVVPAKLVAEKRGPGLS